MKSIYPIVDLTKDLIKKENILSVQILKNIQEMFEQKIHLEMGYSSMFVFCVKELGMSETSAQRRYDALKISQFVPNLPDKIASGQISLSRVAEVSKFMRQ